MLRGEGTVGPKMHLVTARLFLGRLCTFSAGLVRGRTELCHGSYFRCAGRRLVDIAFSVKQLMGCGEYTAVYFVMLSSFTSETVITRLVLLFHERFSSRHGPGFLCFRVQQVVPAEEAAS